MESWCIECTDDASPREWTTLSVKSEPMSTCTHEKAESASKRKQHEPLAHPVAYMNSR